MKVDKKITVALVGNPNSGKTTLFNTLTGQRYKVANYPGVTVEQRVGKLDLGPDLNVEILDLPGIYSLGGISPDEKVATDAILGLSKDNTKPDLVLCVVDSTNLERNLYLVTQIIDLKVPCILALNMLDLIEKRGGKVYSELLSRQIDLPVVEIVAAKSKGLLELKNAILAGLDNPRRSSKKYDWLKNDDYLAAVDQASKDLRSKKLLDPNFANSQDSERFYTLQLLTESFNFLTTDQQDIIFDLRTKIQNIGIDPLTFEATMRYRWIEAITKKVSSLQNDPDKISLSEILDQIFLHKIFGPLIFSAIMLVLFQSIFILAELPMQLIELGVEKFGNFIKTFFSPGMLQSLMVDGIISGVGSVLVFIPQIAILFFLLSLLEDTGYLSRAAYMMDRLLRPFGLQGRSFIPLLSSFACAIPGILSARTIPSKADRLATIFVAPFMSCSARLPVYAVLIGAFIPNTYFFHLISLPGLVLLAMYLLGIFGALIVAWALKRSVLRREPTYFLLELPPYRAPILTNALHEVFDRCVIFLKSAGSMILASAVVMWFLASYPKPPENFQGNAVQYSYAAKLGKTIEPVVRPLGFSWEVGVGIIASFAAREVFVSTLATIYNLDDSNDSTETLTQALKERYQAGKFSLPAALALMVFYVYACQCISTLAVCKKETGSWSWVVGMFSIMSLIAYIMAFMTYQVTKLLVR